MDLFIEIISSILILIGAGFMGIASIGMLRLPDFYIRMSAITKAATLGTGLIILGIVIYFNDLVIAGKGFVIFTFTILTSPVAAHIISRAATRKGVPFWGKTDVKEFEGYLKKYRRVELEKEDIY
ncbi:MAG: monovalent cation/H(+) antiporter subunit G [Cyclobacteriaceae bacterium]|nr:monovalent cation/H(+) antiporter subunit G [Cyclobacteriaceae bacterium]MCH8516422.1 monovalent cation/H(+) antiporter subunit G [Cyclobacteriaceae bacterium]